MSCLLLALCALLATSPADSLVHPAAEGATKAPPDSAVRAAPDSLAKAPGDSLVRPAVRGLATARADSLARPAAKSLAELPGVGVVVEPFAPEAAGALTPKSVQTRIESSLRASGIRVLGERELAADRRMPMLDVSIAFARPLGPAPQVAYLARLDLLQLVQRQRETGPGGAPAPISAVTWGVNRLGAAYSKALRDSLLINLDAMTAAFAAAWRKQNATR